MSILVQTQSTKGRIPAIALTSVLALATSGNSVAAGRVFYDGFESGNTNLWTQSDFRNRCQVVTTAADGVAGPFAGTRMARCNWNGGVAWDNAAAFETMQIDVPYTNEFLLRARLRVDKNLEKTSGSPTKIMRFFNWTGNQSTYLDLFGVLIGDSITNQAVAGGVDLSAYWGDKDSAANPSSWHKVEYYINQAGTIKVWHDGVLVRNNASLKFNGARWTPFYITSNWSDAHDATNYIYYDDVEIFSDNGSGASGSMSDASISASGANTGTVPLAAPQNLRSTGTAP